jgi:hypothetical protein
MIALTAMNPFGAEPASADIQGGGVAAAAQTDQQRAVAEVQAAMMIARANPRDQIRAMDRILNACARPTLAASALYSYARAGTDITGPSIRLAEAVAQQWGNIQFGIRELEQRRGESAVQAFAWDVESNTRREVTFVVPHIRDTKKGRVILTDARDIYETVANMGARRLRACILAIVPGDVIEVAVAQCEATLKYSADTSPAAVRKMLDAFSELGVGKEQVEALIQRRTESIQPAQVIRLRKIYASIKDGMSAPEDWFGMGDSAEGKRPAPEPSPAPLPAMPDGDFEEKLAGWAEIALSGSRTPAQIANMAATKHALTQDQRARILALQTGG